MRICNSCNEKFLNENDKFCSKCGKELKEVPKVLTKLKLYLYADYDSDYVEELGMSEGVLERFSSDTFDEVELDVEIDTETGITMCTAINGMKLVGPVKV